MQERNTKTLVAFVTIFMLARQLHLPMPDGLLRVFDNKAGIATLMFGSAWAATQDASACITAMVLYVISIVLFHTKPPVQIKKDIARAVNDKIDTFGAPDIDSYNVPYQ